MKTTILTVATAAALIFSACSNSNSEKAGDGNTTEATTPDQTHPIQEGVYPTDSVNHHNHEGHEHHEGDGHDHK